MYRFLTVSVLIFALALFGCDTGPTAPDVPTIEETEFDPALNVDLAAMTETQSGLYYRDLEEGSGEKATAGDAVEIRYTGWLTDGTEFDSNLEAEEPLAFVLDARMVIPGVDEGVTGMEVGGVRQLVLPPRLGYGSQPMGSIPANSFLVFEVELEGILDLDEE